MKVPTRVLIVGANGQVGQALRDSAPNGMTLAMLARSQLDIAVADDVSRVLSDFAPQLVINTAAYTAVDKAESEPDIAKRANAEGPAHLAEYVARNAGTRLIHISTDFVFDGRSSTPYAPDAATAPLSTYGGTKLAGEQAVIGIAGDRAVVLRTAWVYSLAGHNFLRTMLRLMRERGSVGVVSDQVGTPTAAASVARALWRLAEMPALCGIFHWTDAGVASWYDFAVAIAEEGAAMGVLSPGIEVKAIATSEYPTPARRPAFSVLDKRSTVAALAITPVYWRQSLRSVMGGLPRA